MPDPILVYATAPDIETAKTIAKTLVEEKLAACVNALPGALSTYRWEGAVEHAGETILFIKSVAENADALKARLVALHPYDAPAFIALPIDAASSHAPFVRWIADQCAAKP